ncbi:MAG: hypothetical protein KDD33_04975, partial [Bdellovibrionales bacterium]|nr:hypothetical protein [Bdellovibrionales bacterium]
EGRGRMHQHVVLCYDKFKYRVGAYDDDFMIPEVNIRKFLRPALQAKLCHIRGLCFMQLIGVHLKAGKFSEDRILQIQKLAENLRQQEDPLPTVILGDWNSYRKDRSGLEKDDIEFFEDILSTDFQPMRSIGKGITTYGTGEWAKDYDHIVISQQLDFYAVEAYPACSDGAPGDYIPYSSFNKYFSDHCPITAQLYVRPPVDSEFHSGDTQVFVR